MTTANVRPLAAGNWKMNGSRRMAQDLAKGLVAKVIAAGQDLAADVLICPPFPYLDTVIGATSGKVAVGGQDCHAKSSGAHTGDVAAAMLADLGCQYVILGHSERRADHRETSAEVKAKATAALAAGLVAIVCVGETEAERGRGETVKVVEKQIVESLPDGGTAANLVVAYEPVWAIGTGRTPTNADVEAVYRAIRQLLQHKLAEGGQPRILFGGAARPRENPATSKAA